MVIKKLRATTLAVMRQCALEVDISMTSQTARAATPQSPILLRETHGSIAVLTLNRPAARNSLSEGLIAELHAALKEIGDDASVRAVVIAANGSAFSAGHDMKELTARRSRRRSRARLFRRDHERLQRDDAGHRAIAQTGGGRGPGCRHRRRMPVGGKLRSRGSVGGRDLCHARASISDCFVRRRWWRCRAMFRASRRWKCC